MYDSLRFYMPHGISVDLEGNVWVTDVALHQVFRFIHGSWDSPDLVLGEAFVPGNDLNHFCMPTDVAISSSGTVYISDGYCNSRILVLSASGVVEDVIFASDELHVPHSLTLLEDSNLLCVADRENKRILCYKVDVYDTEFGQLAFKVEHSRFGQIYAIDHIGKL